MRYVWLVLVGCGFSPTFVGDGGITGEGGGSGSGSDTRMHRKRVTLSVGSPTTLTNFPVSIVTTDTDLANRAPDPGQIAFTAMDGTPLKREIVAYDHATGALEAWLRVPEVSGTLDVFMVYGPGAPAEPMDVWSGFAAAWHFAELTPPWTDSVGTRVVAPPNPGQTPTPTTAGIIGEALTFDGSDDATRTTAHDPTLDFGTGSFSIQAWVNVDHSATAYDEVLFNGGDLGLPGYALTLGTENWLADISDGIEHVAAFGLEVDLLGHWQQLTAVVDRTANRLYCYVNGAKTGESDITGMGSTSGSNSLAIGSTSQMFKFEGTADEIRIMKFPVSPDWIAAEYRNISQRSTFVMFDVETAF